MVRKQAESAEHDIVKLYLSGIGKYQLLSKNDEARLAQVIEAGREAASVVQSASSLTPAKRSELRQAHPRG